MQRLSDTLYNLLNTYTGETQTFNKVTTWLDGSPMTDLKCDGTIFRKKGTEYFKLNWTGELNVKWFGAKGDGITNDTPAIQKAINIFKIGSQGSGQTFLFPSGVYCLDNLIIPSGTRLIAKQTAKYIYIPNLHVKIIPASQSTQRVIYFEDGCINSELEGIYIEGTGYPNLQCAVRFTGNGCNLRRCLFNACQQTAVISSAGNSIIEQCGIFGWYGPAPVFVDQYDYRGALQIGETRGSPGMGDAYLLNNEIGAGLPYFNTYPDPHDMLRDPIGRRICAVAAIGRWDTSVISGNLFENGDRGVVLIAGGLYNTFHNNRYELSGGTGLTIMNAIGGAGGVAYFSFIGERFADNSLAGDGEFEDIYFASGTAGYISIISPIFKKLSADTIPTSTFKVKWNINNQSSVLIDVVSPQIDNDYCLGFINNTDITALPVRQGLLQYDIDNPIWKSISTQEPIGNTQKGYVKLIQGTDNVQNITGGIQFYNSTSTPVALMGFNTGNDLWHTLNQNGGSYVYINGNYFITKSNGLATILNSSDTNGPVLLTLQMGNPTSHAFTINLNPNGKTIFGSEGDIVLGSSGNGSISIHSNGSWAIPESPNIGDRTTDYVLTRNDTTGLVNKVHPTNILPPSSDTISFTTDGTYVIPANIFVDKIIVIPNNNLTSFSIGSSPSITDDIVPSYSLEVTKSYVFDINQFANVVSKTIYIYGITANTTIKFYKR